VGSMKPEDDYRRIKTVREEIGEGDYSTHVVEQWSIDILDGILMIDANQRWDVQEAIDRVSALAEFRPLWVSFLFD
jgi:L-fuconate dehydratase